MWLSLIIGELERERAMRVYVFPRLIKDGKLTRLEACERAARFDAAVDLLKSLVEAGVAATGDLPLRMVHGDMDLIKRYNKTKDINIKGGEQ